VQGILRVCLVLEYGCFPEISGFTDLSQKMGNAQKGQIFDLSQTWTLNARQNQDISPRSAEK
jgi:hypothetical protein